jgi:hypothetical protein
MKIGITVRYLGIEVGDALAVAKQIDVWGQSRHALPPTYVRCVPKAVSSPLNADQSRGATHLNPTVS